MKIVWIVDKQFDVSLDRVTWLETVRHLQKDNEVIIVTGFKTTRPQFEDLKQSIIYIDAPPLRYLRRLVFYRNQVTTFGQLLERLRPTVVLFNTQNVSLLKKAAIARKQYGVRAFLDIRTLPVSPNKGIHFAESLLFQKCIRLAAKAFDGVTYITEGMRRHCRTKFRLPQHRSVVWTSGVDADAFFPVARQKRDGLFRMLYHGNLVENRGLGNLIRALKLIDYEKIELCLVGSGPALSNLEKMAIELSLKDKVIFHPAVPYGEVPRHIQEADIGVLPFPDWVGWNTSSPIKLFEYLACGKPVVVTKIPAHLMILEDREFAFWAETAAPKAIAEAIRSALESRARFDILGQSARHFIEGNFTWEKQASVLEHFLMEQEEQVDV